MVHRASCSLGRGCNAKLGNDLAYGLGFTLDGMGYVFIAEGAVALASRRKVERYGGYVLALGIEPDIYFPTNEAGDGCEYGCPEENLS